MDKENNNIQEISTAPKRKRKSNGRNSPVIGDNGLDISPDENKALTAYALSVFENATLNPVNLDNPAEVRQAITDYFADCGRRGLRPGNLGLYAWLGLSKQDVSNAINGLSKRLNPETIDLIKKAKIALGSYREMLGSMGKINPVTLIFWQKNWDNLVDKQELTIEPKQNDFKQMSPEELRASVPELLDSDIIDE